MTYVDSAILNAAEALCRKFQVLTGRTNVWLAVQLTNLSVVVYFVWIVLHFWTSDVGERLLLGVFCGGLLYLLTQTILKDPIEIHESNAYRRVAKGLRNPRRIRDAMLRISFLTLCVMLVYPVTIAYVALRMHVVLLTYALVVLTTAVLYLLACDPLPPCAAKLTAWLRRPGAAPALQRDSRMSLARLPSSRIIGARSHIRRVRRSPSPSLLRHRSRRRASGPLVRGSG